MKPEPRVAWKLFRSWFIQGIGWYALTEVAARVILEAGFIIVLLWAGYGPLVVFVAWIGFHTGAWFFLYGGFMRIWIVLGLSTSVEYLRAYLAEVSRNVSRRTFAQIVFLRGSGARDEMNERSDIDICVVPQPTAGARIRGILWWWSLRASSVVRWKPLEARWIDAARFLLYHVIEETPRFVKRPATPTWADRLGARGILISVSGIDGTGKTTVARALVSAFRDRGIRADYFYGHRQPWYTPRDGPGISLAILYESLWKRIGRSMEDWKDHRWARTAYQALTMIDYVYVRIKLGSLLTPNRVVVADRYVGDVIAYLRSWGPLFVTLEGLFVGLNPAADLAALLEIPPEKALGRKQEWNLERLRIFVREYDDLKALLSMDRIDASERPDAVRDAVLHLARDRLGFVP